MKNRGRHVEVDLLRGLAMLGMIIIHTTAYFLSNKIASYVWDISQFAVVAFIFCSAYIFFQKSHGVKMSVFKYIKRRGVRLLLPYYFFLLFLLGLTYVGEPQKISIIYILQNIFVVEGVGINWLILLFLQLSVVLPLIPSLYKKRPLFYCFILVSLMSSVVFLFIRPPFNYRIIMWLPLSLVVIFAWYFITYERARNFFALGFFLFGSLFLFLRFILQSLHHSLVMFDNKYPPNLYHIAYGFFIIILLWAVFKKGVFGFFPVKNLLTFLSLYSYSIYFIHFLVIYVLTVFFRIRFTWISFFASVLLITVVLQLLLIQFRYLFSKEKSGPTI